MSSATTQIFKPLSRADACIFSQLSLLASFPRPQNPALSLPARPIRLHLSYSFLPSPLCSKPQIHRSSSAAFVSQTSGWAQQEEDNTVTLDQEESTWENEESDGTQAGLSDWEAEGEDSRIEAAVGDEAREGEEEDNFVEPPEEAKVYVGNLPYDVESHSLAKLFEQAGTVEIAEIIYNRETDRSRGFGFVTMRTVEEAEKAVEMFHRYELDGRLLTVNKAAPKGTRPESRPPRVYEPALRIYVGNLPWDVDGTRLEQIFSEHGKVVDARVVDDRETGRSRGFGFVTMSSEAEMNDAIAALDGQSLDGRAIRVNVAEERPRRF